MIHSFIFGFHSCACGTGVTASDCVRGRYLVVRAVGLHHTSSLMSWCFSPIVFALSRFYLAAAGALGIELP